MSEAKKEMVVMNGDAELRTERGEETRKTGTK